jgi:K+-sensing histidine kinase KdpD
MNAFLDRHPSLLLLVSALLPVAVAAGLADVRDSVAEANAVLLLVVVVVAAAATGNRLAGVVAAASSALSFDFFLTAPYQRLSITDRSDIETAVLLMVVGLGVTEISLWGRRQSARASREHGYLTGVLQTVRSVALRDSETADLTQRVALQLTDVLALDATRFQSHVAADQFARLNHDGTVIRAGRPVDVERSGLPTDTEIELVVQHGGAVYGRYLLVASTRVRRPSLLQRQVAVALADQVGAALAVQHV